MERIGLEETSRRRVANMLTAATLTLFCWRTKSRFRIEQFEAALCEDAIEAGDSEFLYGAVDLERELLDSAPLWHRKANRHRTAGRCGRVGARHAKLLAL
jgi:hypothetical protein